MVKIIHRYIVLELVGPFIFAVAVATFILLLARVFKMVEMIISKGVAVLTVAELFAYYVPALLAMTVPGAMLIATLMAFGRLAGDNEITALKSSGVSLASIVFPVAAVGLLFTGLTYVFLDRVVPESNHRFKNLMLDIGMKHPALNLRERVFVRDFPGYELYVNEVDERTGFLTDITIFRSEGGKLSTIIIAKDGRIVPEKKPGYVVLELYNGEMHEIDPELGGTYRRLSFTSQEVNLEFDTELIRTMSAAKGDREMTVGEMLAEVRALDDAIARVREGGPGPSGSLEFVEGQVRSFNRRKNEFLVEVHKKVAIPFTCVLFVFVGAPLGVAVRRGSRAIGFVLGLAFYLGYYIFLVAGESFGDRGIVPPWLGMWLANIILMAASGFLFYKAVYERSLSDFFGRFSPRRVPFLRRLLLRLEARGRLTSEELSKLDAEPAERSGRRADRAARPGD